MIDTDLERNIAHVRPYLGVLLIGSVALMFGVLIYNAAKQLTETVHTTAPEGVTGAITISSRGDIRYGDTIDFKSTTAGIYSNKSNAYVSTVCFQGETMVYQRSAQQGVPFYLYDQIGSSLDWDGNEASCSATLMYRKVGFDNIDVYVVDSVSFDVISRGY
jgi:hypothetical protein